MGSLFRSEEMTLAQLYLQTDAAYRCVSEMGELVRFRVQGKRPVARMFPVLEALGRKCQ